MSCLRAGRLGATLLLVGVLLGCGPAGETDPSPAGVQGPPNVVLVVLCSFRADRLGVGLTPHLDRWADEGTRFDHAVSASSWTKPSTASLLTGLTPNVHQMIDYHPLDEVLEQRVTRRRVLPESMVTLPEVLAEAGYDTACRVNNVHAGSFFGLTQGCADEETRHRMRTPEIVEDLGDWLGGGRDAPFFFMAFTRDVHTPYNPDPDAFNRLRRARGRSEVPAAELVAYRRDVDRRIREAQRRGEPVPAALQDAWIDLYDAQVPALDEALGEIEARLEAAGELDETVIVVTADHGEHLFEGGRIGHGELLGEPVLRIPLFLKGPGIESGRRLAPVVRSIDLLPTLSELAGVDPPRWIQGRSVLPLLRGEEEVPRTAFSTFQGRAHTLRSGRFKLFFGPGARRSLHDLDADPLEQGNLLADRPRTARRLSRELRRWLDEEKVLAAAVEQAGDRELPEELVEQLRSLGYLD